MELTLSPTEIEELRKLQCNLQGRSDYARVTCILMLSMGNTPIFVADCLGIDISTIYRYRSLYLEGGLDKLLENRYRGYQGLLNAYDVTDVIALDCECVNAESTKELYELALKKHPNAKNIYIISDNARYYHNKELQNWVEDNRIKQIFLPPYSPNLNLIERLWKFLRKKVINTGFYRNKTEFRDAIRNFFDNIHTYKKELESLLTLNFRLINSQTISF